MTLFSQHYGLSKSQPELDFIDVPIDGDLPLFVDPFAISQRIDPWSRGCHHTILGYFQSIVDLIRASKHQDALKRLLFLQEPNETRLGYSSYRPRGSGIGNFQAKQLFEALSDSSAVRTGFIQALEECELLIDGISRDKISDLTTNIIRIHLIDYTDQQCKLWNIPTQQVPLSPFYSLEADTWKSDYFDLPVAAGKPILLVPKVIARYDPAYNHQKYYRNFVLEYLRAEHLNANSSLVILLKNGKRVVHKKDLKEEFPLSKKFLYEFSKEHPGVLEDYRKFLKNAELSAEFRLTSPELEKVIATAQIVVLKNIPPGNESATDYHNLLIGVLELLLFPNLLNPRKEKEIHDGRKRIDIMMENGAHSGVFFDLHMIKKIPSAFVPIECKNYATEVGNPELDQLQGRFSERRGKFGILCCRSFEDRQKFISRCRDTFKDGRGLIIPLDDNTIVELLKGISLGNRNFVDVRLRELVNEVFVS